MTRKFVIIATVGLIFMGAVMWQLGVRAQTELKTVATEQFNQQQLILARKLAQDLEQHFDFLRASLLELTGVWRKHPEFMSAPDKALPPFQEILRTSQVLAIGYAPAESGKVTLYNAEGEMPGPLALDYGPFLQWARGADLRLDVLVGQVEAPESGPFAGRTVLRMAARLWPAEPGAGQPGVVFLVVDAMAVAIQYAHDVRSGQTGYAWVLDQRGYFLDHYVPEFVGRDAFTVRKERDPSVDFSRIDQIMREDIMAGKEGNDWYVSGWHRGVVGEQKKLMSYTPARLAPGQIPPVVWGVAVVAPVDEVEGIIGQAAARQMLMVAIFQVVVVLGLAVTLYFAFRWSASLKNEVDQRTLELREARDKLKANLRTLLETQERLIRSERFAAIGEAAAHISHEIKNPLMLMAGFARQVRRTLPEDGKEAGKLLLVEEEARRLEGMLEEVKDFTRPAAPRFSSHDLNATVWDTAMLMEASLAAKGVTLRVNLDKNLPPTEHDPSQIRQVVLNLVKNAAEAMGQGGQVAVSTRAKGRMAELEVRDTGPGLPPDQAKLAFNPFYTTKEHGTGLGLPVCYRIARDHGGDIRLETAPGKGCAFTVTLPLDRPSGAGDDSPPDHSGNAPSP